tara:strand:+ start:541 stop:1731 length:1191 start_codon:yes stop_codon:yes gene_type:complete
MDYVKPFRAVRVNSELMEKFCTYSHINKSKDDLKKILSENPNSFLQIISDSVLAKKKISLKNRYKKVKIKYEEFKKKGIINKDPNEGFYIHEINLNGNEYTGLIALAPLRSYEQGIIKKHEATIEHREKLFENYLKETRFNAEPVLIAHNSNETLSLLIKNLKKKKPTNIIKFRKNEIHKFWYVRNISSINKIINEFNNVKSFFIADGHHRTASSYRLLKNKTNVNNKYFMVFLIPFNELKFKSYNRIIKKIDGFVGKDFLKKLKEKFNIKIQKEEKNKGLCMYLNGQNYSLSLKRKFIENNSPLYKLNSFVLQEKILKPILGIQNPRNEKKLLYTQKSLKKIINQFDPKKFEIAFGLEPVSIEDINNVVEMGLLMPPKSTNIFPKLRSGLTIYEL